MSHSRFRVPRLQINPKCVLMTDGERNSGRPSITSILSFFFLFLWLSFFFLFLCLPFFLLFLWLSWNTTVHLFPDCSIATTPHSWKAHQNGESRGCTPRPPLQSHHFHCVARVCDSHELALKLFSSLQLHRLEPSKLSPFRLRRNLQPHRLQAAPTTYPTREPIAQYWWAVFLYQWFVRHSIAPVY